MSEKMKVHYSSETNEWATPQNVFDVLNDEFNFMLDPCATKENAKTEKFFTIEDDGLSQEWTETTFMNPPYGREIKKWVKKAYEESLKGTVVVCLIPARTDTSYWHEYIFEKACEIRFVKGRIKFGDSEQGAPFPSAVVIFNEHNAKDQRHTYMTTQRFDEFDEHKRRIGVIDEREINQVTLEDLL